MLSMPMRQVEKQGVQYNALDVATSRSQRKSSSYHGSQGDENSSSQEVLHPSADARYSVHAAETTPCWSKQASSMQGCMLLPPSCCEVVLPICQSCRVLLSSCRCVCQGWTTTRPIS